jgi:hypothetical protein
MPKREARPALPCNGFHAAKGPLKIEKAIMPTSNQVLISIAISTEDAAEIGDLLTDAGEGDHGRLDLATLAALLLEDVTLMRTRPGSWEGSNMHALLSAHGYDVFG